MTLPAKTPRPKKCRCCKEQFQPQKPLQVACGVACAVVLARAKSEKERKAIDQIERREIKAAKERIKSRAEHAKEAQVAFNRYVRLRDADLGCVSCPKPAEWGGQWHASHFRSVGAAAHLRFNLLNVHKACSVCNNHLSGNIMGYRPELARRIGESRVQWLECNQDLIRHDITYLKRLKAVFTKKAKRALARRIKGAAA